MNIYIQKDGQKLGPFTKDDLRNKTYSGELSRSLPACVEGGTEWVELGSLLNAENQPPLLATQSPGITDLDELRDPKERLALAWLYVASIPAWLFILLWIISSYGIILIIFGFVWLIRAIAEMMFAAYVKTNAVRVSPTQLPEVYRAVQSCCERMGMDAPDVYVMQHNIWNAFAAKIFGQRMVVLFSFAVDSILLKGDMQQLTWLVGHELGHHWAGHLNISQKLAKVGGWLVWVNLWHSRRAELTCDRVGLHCAGSLRASQLALVNATVGAHLAGKVNIYEAAGQWQMHQGEFFVKYRTLYATHPHLLARLYHLNSAAAELGIGA